MCVKSGKATLIHGSHGLFRDFPICDENINGDTTPPTSKKGWA